MTIQYHRCGDYLLPNLIIEDQKTQPIGKYGRIRKRYLKEHRPGLYGALWIEGKLTPHLLEINETAFAQIDLIVRQLLKAYPAPDRSLDHLAYVAHMNSLTAMAEETVLRDLIYQ